MSIFGNSVPEEDQTGVCFKDSRWLEIFPLNKDSVLDYFSFSGFYDRTCNNEQIKMQRLSLDKLHLMKGIEYELISYKEPHLYIIRKQRREGPTIVIPQANYYIINGTIYQSPNIFSVAVSRVLKSVYHLQKSFKEASNYSNFDIYTGFTWDFNKDKPKADSSESKNTLSLPIHKASNIAKQKEMRAIEDQRGVDRIISSLASQFPLPPTPSIQPLRSPNALGTTIVTPPISTTTPPATPSTTSANANIATSTTATVAAPVSTGTAQSSANTPSPTSLVDQKRKSAAPLVDTKRQKKK